MENNSTNFVLTEMFSVRLEMKSDWHIGTGAGIPKNIDALISKDADGFPQIPAKSIVGMWRDALEILTLGLDNGTEGDWSKWVEIIFGIQPNRIDKNDLAKRLRNGEKTYSQSILSLQPARISEKIRNKINSFDQINQTKYKQALTFIKPEIKIDEISGTAEENMLRFAEMGRIGTILETKCELNWENFTEEQKKLASALLIASTKLVDRIGGKRRRGAGRCEFTISKKEVSKEIIDFLRSADAANIPTPNTQSGIHTFSLPTADTIWQKLDYTLTLQTPVAIVTATLGNVSETLDFIPGTYLLPHISKSKNLFQHIANGDLQVSPATINVNGERGLPVPRVSSAHKVGGGFDKKETVYNKFKNETKADTPQLKPFRQGFVSDLGESGKLPIYAKTPEILLMHNTVKDELQRPDASEGGVYSRQAIAAGTVLKGEIRFKRSLALDFSKISEHIRLGTSKKDDYGLAELKILESSNPDSSAVADKDLVIYLESDALIRNKNLRQTNLVCVLKELLEQKLSVTLTLQKENSLIQTRRIESWNVSWGFPRPTLIAMAAGSCVKFEIENYEAAKQPEISTALQNLENSGIGERRGEGYGRIRFNPKMLTEPINSWEIADGIDDEDNLSTESLTADDFIKQLEKTRWREELQRAVLLIADDETERPQIFGFEAKGTDSVPPLSQIGGLRSSIMRMQTIESKNSVISWLEHLEETSNRIKKWDKNDSAEKAKEKTTKIKDLLNQKSKIWLILCETKINEKDIWQTPTILSRNTETLQDELWAEAVRALFDACMRSHKRKLDELKRGQN